MTVIDWLLDSDLSIRWQVMRALMHQPAEVIDGERARIATDAWGPRVLALRAPDALRGWTMMNTLGAPLALMMANRLPYGFRLHRGDA
jgi:hypothetical protein